MTVQLNWPQDVVSRLSREAREKGLSLDTYLLQAVLHDKFADNPRQPKTPEETGRSVHDLQKGRRSNLPMMKGTVIGSLSRRDIYDDRG
jgi:hypothetical protein